MLNPSKRDIVLYRNADWYEQLTFTSGGTPIDISGYTFKLAIKSTQLVSADELITATNTSNTAITGIVLSDPENGSIIIRVLQSALLGLASNPVTTSDNFGDINYDYYYYDLKVTANGIPQVYLYGTISLYSGIAE